MKTKFLILIICITILASVIGCSPTTIEEKSETEKQSVESVFPLSFTDGLGKEIILEAYPQKIISLAPSNTEILFAIGARQQVIGRDFFSDYPVEALELPVIGDMTGNNLEVITDLQPDLVLAAEINSPDDIQAIEDLGFTVYTLSNPLDLDGLYENLRIMAQLSGHEDEAETLITSLKSQVEEVVALMKDVETRPRIFYELDASDSAKPWTVGQGTYHELMIQMAGGENIGSIFDTPYPQISQEELILQNPEIILLSDAMWGITAEMVAERPGWSSIKAVQNKAIYPFDANLLDRPGPRMVQGLIELAHLIHPEIMD
ncbi:MAG: cobalamin-binding protein [Anaerolineaceae bacterium]|nr:cobalamin-binding protein [Anaerolineaceae bacterium]